MLLGVNASAIWVVPIYQAVQWIHRSSWV